MSYHRPVELDSALDLLAADGGKIIAGGTDVYPSAKPGVHPEYYLDITAITGLSDISHTSEGTRIGASVTWSQIAHAPLPAAFDGLKQAAHEVGSIQIQNAGTLVGNLCNASPAADGVPPLLTLDAQVELQSAARGTRQMPLDAFLQGVRKTSRAPDELVTAICIPPVATTTRSAFEKLGSRRYLVISITMCAAVIDCDVAGRITQAKVAVGACSAVATRLPALETALIGKRTDTITITPADLTGLSPITDVRGSAAYRLDVVAEQCRRAIQKAMCHE
ncbi:xanthine dehydrogenase family protein subunit M [Roseobacter sp.]|uniref:FAD binding domain-containing protein n=1 Tax=Roseobacter sp. TaxID=1907202 RepID=UPI0032995AE7